MSKDVHTLTGAYVLDALSELERRAFEDHMSGCAACSLEVAELRETTARLGAATAAPPPPMLWNKVLAATAHARQLPPNSSSHHPVARPRRRVAVFAAAVSLLAAAGLGTGWVVTNNSLNSELAQTQQELDTLQAVLSAPDVVTSNAPVTGGGTATAVVSKSRNGMVMLVRGLRALPEGQIYQAWYVGSGGPTSAGMFNGSTGSIAANDLTLASRASTLGLTVEPAGGSTKPTTDVLALVPIPS